MFSIKTILRKRLRPQTRQRIRSLFVTFLNLFFQVKLDDLANLYGTDKNYKHDYTKYYDMLFSKIRHKKIILLEIGIGGYEQSNLGGASLRMWKKYFKRGLINGIDIYDKKKIEEKRIRTFKVNQTDQANLERVITKIGSPDIIIDDGSHHNGDVIKTFMILFPHLNSNGFYIIEDVHTSYRDSYGGDSKTLENKQTTMNFFKKITDNSNLEFFNKELLDKSFIKTSIDFIWFTKGMIIIKK